MNDKFGAIAKTRSARRRKAASRCWWAPYRSRSRSCCPNSSPPTACRTRCLTPAITSRKPASWRRRAALARSRSRPTWPAAAPTSSWAATLEFRLIDEHAELEMEARPEFDAAAARIRIEIEQEKAAVLAAGGLFVLGTERHESRRIDNQLRGRSGRQGDPGLSRFYLEPGRRSAAHLRPADDVREDDEQESGGWRGDHQPVDLQGDRDRARRRSRRATTISASRSSNMTTL